MTESQLKFRLSVIVPSYNEARNGLLYESLKSIRANLKDRVEIILVDRESKDGTIQTLRAFCDQVIITKKNKRSDRLNIGIQKANAKYIFLHHPRNFVGEKGILEVFEHLRPKVWGGLTHKFHENNHILLKFTSWYSNFIRFDRKGIVYLDHCIFFDREMLSMPVIPSVDIFEDTLLSLKLRKQNHPIRIKHQSPTSPIRFETKGVWTQALLNQWLKVAFYFNLDKQKMNKIYENQMDLNSNYRKE
ncbi:MAG: glycosyltransferase [Bdellovibrionales bacterium]|nr:glycosyltransferase [Bdellovibrionales bacterium]